ncbi:beta-eliminating lyase [Apiospora arundinis]|uniref:Beta-eliminating lyase n=1 Tax=Apiospora arundinis TaxID=335852 RepID=A0ABR2JNI8_9PEZI
MLAAISKATLNDDVYGEDKTTCEFEERMASICGKEAAAFVVSGTMANQLSLAALAQAPCSILADATAHIIHFEAGGVANLAGASIQPVRPSNGHYLTLEDVQKHAIVGPAAALERCPATIISLENTAHGNIIPLTELQAIKAWADEQRIAVHIDGARVWHAVAAGGGSLRELAACCDAMTLCFGKGLAAPIGAAIVGSALLVQRVKRVRQSIGGGVRKSGVLAAAAWQAVWENFGPGDADVRGVLRGTHDVAREVADLWTSLGGRLLRRVETNLIWLDLRHAGVEKTAFNDLARRHGVKVRAPRLVLHQQVSPDALHRLGRVFREAWTSKLVNHASRIDGITPKL